MNELEKCAEILFESGLYKATEDGSLYYEEDNGFKRFPIIDPFSDTIEGRRQADAIELWLLSNGYREHFNHAAWAGDVGGHQWRLDRIKWCIQELI